MKRRFKCNDCFRECETTHMVGMECAEDAAPGRCLEYKSVRCTWSPIEESKPPKLTQDIFETGECPAWATYAAVDAYGVAYFYGSRPVADLITGSWYLPIDSNQVRPYRGSEFDTTDWSTNLLQREFATPGLSDWVYNGEHGYHEEYGYIQLGEILDRETQVTIISTGENCYVDNVGFSNGRIVEARKRPLNSDEMLSLLGKVAVKENGDKFLVTYVPNDGSFIDVGYDISYTPEELMERNIIVDGNPSYVIEHRNKKGEWVK